jgi:hypothetical protein
MVLGQQYKFTSYNTRILTRPRFRFDLRIGVEYRQPRLGTQ